MSHRPLTTKTWKTCRRCASRGDGGRWDCFCVLLASAVLAGFAPAQTTTSGKKPRPSLSDYVPGSAPLFVSVRSLSEVDDALGRAHAWRLISLITGTSVRTRTADVRSGVQAFLGPQAGLNLEELMALETGLVAPSWRELGKAVCLVRLSAPGQIESWFPPDRRLGGDGAAGERLFRTHDGMIVAVKESIAAIAPRQSEHSVVRDTFRLLTGRRDGGLSESADYRELVSYLPPRWLAMAYFNTPGLHSAAPPPVGGWLSFHHLVAGLYGGEGRVDVAIRAARSVAQPSRPLGSVALDRLMKLPATTLGAWAMTVDFAALQTNGLQQPATGVLARYLALAEGLRQAGSARIPFAAIGPHVLIAWDQDFQDAGALPQLAILVEARDAAALAVELEHVADAFMGSVDSVADGSASIFHSTHLGVRLRHLPLAQLAQVVSSGLVQGLGQVELSWTAQGEWLVLATSRTQLERIIEAQQNLVPTMANVPDMQSLHRGRVKLTSLVIAQPDLAAGVLEGWAGGRDEQPAPWLEGAWWHETLAVDGLPTNRLGIGMRGEQEPGVVTVARVYAGTPADGRLEPDDRIVGMNGQLLDLVSPNADLRRRWMKPGAVDGHVLRVLRGEAMIEVPLPLPPEGAGASSVVLKPVDAVRELASIGGTMRFVSWAVHATEETQYSALVSMRFRN
jgi:hypothetical protein